MSCLAQPASACGKHAIETREVILDSKKSDVVGYLFNDMQRIVSRSASYIHLKDEYSTLNNALLVIFNETKPFHQWKSCRLGVKNTAYVDVLTMHVHVNSKYNPNPCQHGYLTW